MAGQAMPVGAVAAVWFVMVMTHSRPSKIGGPVDGVLLLGLPALGTVGNAILVYIYTVQSLLWPMRNGAQTRD